MILLSNTQETVFRFDAYLEDFRDVFRCNGVDFGSPEDFFAFARTVKFHSELRCDVARVAKAVIENEANVSLRTILTVIAVASGGDGVAAPDEETSAEMNTAVNLVVGSLINSGVCGRLHADDPDRACLDLIAEAPVQISVPEGSSLDDKEAARDMDMESDGPNTLAKSLTQLELNSLQLKVYLDSIDQRIDRIEPRLKSVGVPVPPDRTIEDAEAGFSRIISSETDFRLHDDAFQSNERDRVATGVWSDLGRSSSFRAPFAVPVFIGVGTLLFAASLFLVLGRHGGNAVVRPMAASVEAGGSSGSPGLAPVVSVADPSTVSVRSTDESSTDQRANPPADKVPRVSKKSAQIPLRSPVRSSSLVADGSAPLPKMATDTPEGGGEPDRVSILNSEAGSDHLVNVSSGVMAANLVLAPKPSYPMFASLTRMQGNVVLRAVISKDGSVERLQVLQGHHLLRGAAKRAVQNWRYRPYKIDGVPVEVATIVSVDFSLHH